MTRDFNSLFSEWLEDGPTRASDRVLDHLAADLVRTPQRKRPFFFPRRPSAMSTTLKLGIAAAAMIAVTVSFALVTRAPAPFVGGSPSPSSSPAASPSAPPSPAGSPSIYRSTLHPFEIALPPGWSGGLAPSGEFEQWQRFNPLVSAFVGSTVPPAGMPIDQYVADAVSPEGESACSSDPVEIVDTTLGGEPAFEIVYECDSRGFGLIATGHNGRRYVLGSEAADLPGAREALDQLQPGFAFTD